jgi:hypothetical protein
MLPLVHHRVVAVNHRNSFKIESFIIFSNKRIPSQMELQIVRDTLGFGSLLRRCKLIGQSACTYDRLTQETKLDITRLLNESEANLSQSTTEFLQCIIMLLGKGILINIAELGHYVNGENFGYTYIGMFVRNDRIPGIQKMSEEDDNVHVYICDAMSEVEMRKKEKNQNDAKQLLGYIFDKEARKMKPVARDNTTNYYYSMMLRYPFDELGEVPLETLNHIGNEYTWVQARMRMFGQKTEHLAAFVKLMVE